MTSSLESRPSRWMLTSSGVDFAIVSFLAIHGILMAALAPMIVAGLLATLVLYIFIVDYLKIAIFPRFGVN